MLALIKLIARPLFRILFSVEYHGLENVPDEGAVILAGNHPSYLDPILIILPIKRVIRFMAWDALFRVPLLGSIIKAMGAFPVDIRRGKGEAAYREALRVLTSGAALGIFPEGQRSERGPMDELRSGTARLAIETGAPIVPITIGGASRAWPKHRLLPKPAKIVVRYHKPIDPEAIKQATHLDDRGLQQEVMQAVAASINRSLAPALHGSDSFEKWYRQPPSNIRSYEWAPLIAALVATLVAGLGRAPGANWLMIWLPVAGYYLYLIADLLLIKQGRTAKWLRNSMPIWLILAWHYPLITAIGLPAGELNALLVCAALAAFFPFFWEDYFTLQKFVRGLVVVYYFSLALQLGWPHGLGIFVALLGFIIVFSLRYKTLYYQVTVALMLIAVTVAIILKGGFTLRLLCYAALAVVALGYIQTFVAVAYDIRRAGNVSLPRQGRSHSGT
ncbi:MAG: 1-acyl-sn-glycerol-3-phosphate acyltransferase [Blastocatellia bacterium]